MLYSSLDVKRFRHVASTWLSDAYDACCCWKDRLDPGICKGAIEEDLTLSVERGAVVDEGDNCMSSLAEHHCDNNDKSSERTNLSLQPRAGQKPCLSVWPLAV